MALDAGSFFIYDLPAMLEEAVRGMWTNTSSPTGRRLVECTRIFLSGDSIVYESNNLVESNMTCGMVAWLVSLVTPECQGLPRRAVFIGNDISYQLGTFSLEEDKLYLGASELARKEGIPRIYIACNSGARLGLC